MQTQALLMPLGKIQQLFSDQQEVCLEKRPCRLERDPTFSTLYLTSLSQKPAVPLKSPPCALLASPASLSQNRTCHWERHPAPCALRAMFDKFVSKIGHAVGKSATFDKFVSKSGRATGKGTLGSHAIKKGALRSTSLSPEQVVSKTSCVIGRKGTLRISKTGCAIGKGALLTTPKALLAMFDQFVSKTGRAIGKGTLRPPRDVQQVCLQNRPRHSLLAMFDKFDKFVPRHWEKHPELSSLRSRSLSPKCHWEAQNATAPSSPEVFQADMPYDNPTSGLVNNVLLLALTWLQSP